MMTRRSFLSAAAAIAATTPRWLLGANTAIQGYGLYHAIDLLHKLEFEVIEIHPMGTPQPTPKVFPGFQFDSLSASEKAKLKRALRPFRQVTAHLPYTGLNWLSPDEATRQRAIRTVDIALEGAAYFGARLTVLHPQPLLTEPWKTRENEYLDAIRRWGDRAQKLGIRIALETGFPPSVAEFTSFIQTINHPNIGATIDVGHQGRYTELTARVQIEDRPKPESIKAYNDTTLAIIERLGPKVFHFHVHDIDPETWVEHKPMVHGFVDYPRLFATLKAIGYTGALILEIGGDPEKMPDYLRNARDKFRAWLQ